VFVSKRSDDFYFNNAFNVEFNNRVVTFDCIKWEDVLPLIQELESCYAEIADKEAIIAEKFDYKERIKQRLVTEHYHLGANATDNAEEMQKVRDIIDYVEKL
jgi:hypothetical protein